MPDMTWEWVDHRVSDAEVERDREPFRRMAQEFLYGYEGDMEFLVNVQENSLHRLTVRQTRGVINCMRTTAYGRAILERGPVARPPRPEPAPRRPAPPPRVDEVCPQVRHRQEHGGHWFPLRLSAGQQRCLGWHRMTRRAATKVRARFHRPFVRASKGNLLHRSTHDGWVEWYPEDLHQPGPSLVGHWWVGRACTRGATPLKDPDTLTVEDARAARPHVGPGVRHDRLVLCPECFPGTTYEPVGAP